MAFLNMMPCLMRVSSARETELSAWQIFRVTGLVSNKFALMPIQAMTTDRVQFGLGISSDRLPHARFILSADKNCLPIPAPMLAPSRDSCIEAWASGVRRVKFVCHASGSV